MKKILMAIATAILLLGCKTIYVPVQGETIVKDSLIVETRIDTIEVKLPAERVRDWTGLLDTLRLETSLAISTTYLDTTISGGFLTGTLVNKETPVEVYVPSTSKLEVRDSIVYKEIPYKVEIEKEVTPKLYPWSLCLNIILIITIGLGIYLKLKR